MSDVHVLVCSDFYPKSALGEMWVKCMKCTGWSQLACSDGSDLYVYDICQQTWGDYNTNVIDCDYLPHVRLEL